MAFEATAIVKLAHDTKAVPHEFFVLDDPVTGEAFGGTLDLATEHFKNNIPGAVNLRVRKSAIKVPTPVKAAALTAAPTPTETATSDSSNA